jgi:IS4 transposase
LTTNVYMQCINNKHFLLHGQRIIWQVELFFKWMKQHLRIKAFYGISFNAVCVQIWIAVCVYHLIPIVKRKMNMEKNHYTILQTLSLWLFEKTPLNHLFEKQIYIIKEQDNNNQLNLFGLQPDTNDCK